MLSAKSFSTACCRTVKLTLESPHSPSYIFLGFGSRRIPGRYRRRWVCLQVCGARTPVRVVEGSMYESPGFARRRSGVGARHVAPRGGAGIPGRLARIGQGRRRRDSRRGSHADQRTDQHQAVDGDQRARRVRLRQHRSRHLRPQGGAAGVQDDRARRHPRRHAAVPHARSDAGGRRDRREHHRHGAVADHRDGERLAGHGARLRGAADAAGAGPRRVPRSASRSRRSSRPATASTTGSRIRPTRRCCRSAAARAAATTTCSTACRSPT